MTFQSLLITHKNCMPATAHYTIYTLWVLQSWENYIENPCEWQFHHWKQIENNAFNKRISTTNVASSDILNMLQQKITLGIWISTPDFKYNDIQSH